MNQQQKQRLSEIRQRAKSGGEGYFAPGGMNRTLASLDIDVLLELSTMTNNQHHAATAISWMVTPATATTQPEMPQGNARSGATTESINWNIGESMPRGKMAVHILRLTSQ